MGNTKKSLWQIFSLSGAIGVLFYTAHVVIGGVLWNGYSHITQTISELTACGAPDAYFLRILTTFYGILLVIFSICMYFLFKKLKVHKVALFGAALLITMEIFSFAGYSLFPLDHAASMMDFQNLMHIVVTSVVVLCTIGSSYCIGIGLMKKRSSRPLGVFIFICAVIITLFGALTPIVIANNISISGLTERINIFTLQTWIFVLSVCLYKQTCFVTNNNQGVL